MLYDWIFGQEHQCVVFAPNEIAMVVIATPAGRLVIDPPGNFGDGRINAYDIFTDNYIGFLKDANGAPLVIPGLRGLQFGSGTTNGGDAETLFFAADVDGTHGLLGSLRPAADSVQP